MPNMEMEMEIQPTAVIATTSCDRHPGEPVIGFCASCLRERLAGLEATTDPPRKSTSTALKSIFSRPSSGDLPALRRCKSFSSSRSTAIPLEPQRKSCDVRSRNTLSSLFHQEELSCHQNEAPLKPMKDHIEIDLDSQAKKIPGSFWLAASVFSKKLGVWRRKQKLKKKPDSFGRRSCDIDAGRFSFDDPRFSWDVPRASWDGCLIGGGGGRGMVQRVPTMLSVVEDGPAAVVERFDGEIPVEEDLVAGNLAGDVVPCYQGSKHDRDSRELGSESFDSGSRDQQQQQQQQQQGKVPPLKKTRRWSKAWNIWGLINRRKGGRSRGNGILRSNSNGSLRSCGLKKKKEEGVLERNRSSRYSSSHFDNGMLRFYLPPIKDGKRGRNWGRNNCSSSSHSFTGSMLSLY